MTAMWFSTSSDLFEGKWWVVSPEWLTAAGGAGAVVLAFLKFGYEVWEKHRPKGKADPPTPGPSEGEPPAQAA